MQDAQGPRDSGDGAGDPPRRAGLRLRDAEAVATVRRDMFGDGSLIDALTGPPAAAEATGNPPDPAASAQSAEPSPPEPDAAEGHGDTARQKSLDDAAGVAAPVPFADEAQSLDAIIDSFPAEPSAGQPHRSGNEAEASLAASPPDPSAVPGTAADASEPPPGAVPAIAQPQTGISSLFDSLGGIEQHDNGVQPTEEPPAPSAPILDLDMSMLERSPARRRLMRPEAESPAAALPSGAPPPSIEPELQAPEIQATETETDEVQPGGGPDLDMSMLERLPTRPVLQPRADDDTQAGEIGPVALPYETDAPGEPEARAGRSERSDAADTPQGVGELPEAANPPFVETLAMPAFAEPSELAPHYLEPLAAPYVHGSPEPQVLPAHTGPGESAAQPMFDAAAKIAAEAQATAEALDNLRRFLAPSAPGLQEPIELPGDDPGHIIENAPGHFPTRSPAHTPLQLNLHGGSTPFQSSGPAALMPMPLPVPPDRKGTKGIYVLGFLTGVGLSLMAGIALYILINMV